MLELDVLLGKFLDHAYIHLSRADQALFVELLTCSDQDLYLWLTNRAACDQPVYFSLLEQIKKYAAP